MELKMKHQKSTRHSGTEGKRRSQYAVTLQPWFGTSRSTQRRSQISLCHQLDNSSLAGATLTPHHDTKDYVVIFHGDLGTAERVQTLKELMSLFNLKMACADAIWCIFIEQKAARDDAMSLMHFVALNR
jgi:hypothetical protein